MRATKSDELLLVVYFIRENCLKQFCYVISYILNYIKLLGKFLVCSKVNKGMNVGALIYEGSV